MSENQSADLLEEVYKATQMGLEATRLVTHGTKIAVRKNPRNFSLGLFRIEEIINANTSMTGTWIIKYVIVLIVLLINTGS